MLSFHHPTASHAKDGRAPDPQFPHKLSHIQPRNVPPRLGCLPQARFTPCPLSSSVSGKPLVLRTHIDILPPKLLSQVFISCISREGWPWRDNISMKLTHVCARWRALCLSLSALWSTVVLQGGRCFPDWPNRHLQMWLECSRDRPLKIFLPHNVHISMIYPIISNIHCCDELIIDLASDTSARATLHIPFINAALLRTLAICTSDCHPETLDQVYALMRSAPNLCQLDWHDCQYLIPGALFNYTWSQLSRIIIAGQVSLEQFYLLQRSQNLECIEVGLDLAPALARPNNITHPKLSSLKVHTYRYDLSTVLDVLTLPSLHTLHLTSRSKPDSPRVHTALENMLARSSCKLEALTLDFALERDIVACITCPSLRFLCEVYLTCCDNIGHATVERLFLPPKPSTPYIAVLPCLSKLSLSGCLTPDGILTEMVMSRWRSRAFRRDGVIIQLSFVSINFRRYSKTGRQTHVIDNEIFGALIKEGLDIRRLWIFRLLPL